MSIINELNPIIKGHSYPHSIDSNNPCYYVCMKDVCLNYVCRCEVGYIYPKGEKCPICNDQLTKSGKPRGHWTNRERDLKIIGLRGIGVSYKQIAKEMEVTVFSVQSVLKRKVKYTIDG